MPLLHMSVSFVAPSFTSVRNHFAVWISLWCVCVFVYDEAKGNISIGYCTLSSVIIPKLYKKVCDCLLIV